MKINRSGPAGPTSPTDQPSDVEKTGGKDFAQKLDRPTGPSGAAPAGGQGPVSGIAASGSSLVADIAADLKAGKITPEVAVDRAMERVLDNQVGSDAPAGLRTKVEAALKEAVANDPVLLAKIERLRS